MKLPLLEYRDYQKSDIQVLTEDTQQGGKNLYMRGVFIEGDTTNANGRVYPRDEIQRAVRTLQEQIQRDIPILGEADHPSDLKINLDRVSHAIVEMWMDGSRGLGKLKILPTPMGNLIRALLESGVKLGVSSRGSGEVDDRTGRVSDFEIITVDIVAQPSAHGAWPQPIYESMMNHPGGYRLWQRAQEAQADPRVQQYLQTEITKFIRDLKI